TFDLCAPDVDCHADLTDMNMIKDNECDFFICSHMLEHIENDRKAIAELYRITKYGGKGILMAPISTAIESTIENLPDVKTDEDRWKYYGQNDHIRLYARKEFVERITQSGFELEMYDIDNLGKSFLKKNGLKETTVLYIVKKK
ncbi:MAG TPA: methyltransferase domain-containing protein, partial [Spirochaetota bacterium]|nr:methyltransferase domain-containing protein [Spirochaetota bacterium]